MTNDVFAIPTQDRVWKQQFFYSAFRALWYNRIDGDYAEFGCWSASTRRLPAGLLAFHD